MSATQHTPNLTPEKQTLLNHHTENHFTAGKIVRDIIIGVSDGLTVPFALAAGLSGANATSSIVLTAGAISMGLGGFIENFGTHILVGLSIGGKDLLLVKQDVSSNLDPSELKMHLDELGNQLFTGTCIFLPKSKEHKYKVPQAFDVFGPQIVAFNSSTSVCAKDRKDENYVIEATSKHLYI